jgi:hypothetical protein
MEAIYVFVLRNDVWIYILCVLGLFWYASEFLRARHILRRAMFGLEWETGTRMRNTAFSAIFLLLTLIGAVYYVNTRVAPTLPPELLRPPTPTPNIFATPLTSPTPLGTPEDRPLPFPTLAATITLSSPSGNVPAGETPANGDAVATPGGPTPTPFVDCTLVLNITEPRDGAVVSGSISFFGTADTENFQFYRLEANGPQTGGQWSSLLGRTVDQPVRDGFLGSVNLSQWSSGPYLIRLTAVDTANSETGYCVIQVTLDNG